MKIKSTVGQAGSPPQRFVTRREFLAAGSGLLASTAIGHTKSDTPVADTEMEIEQPRKTVELNVCTLRINPTSGDLIGIHWKDPALEVIAEPRLGENFRILLPRPGYEANYFYSREQKVSRIDESSSGVTCTYESLRNDRENANVSVRYHIRSVEKHLEFSIEINNSTDLPLGEVFFGIVGGQQGLVKRQETESLVPGFGGGTPYSNAAPDVFTKFKAGGYGGGNLGIRYDAAAFTYPGSMHMGWMEFFNRKANLGLHYANHDLESRLTALYYELRPFTKSAVPGDNWATPDDVPAGEPIGLTMGWLNFPYQKGGKSSYGPVVFQLHQGDWHEGSKLYRHWFDQHFQVKRTPSWLRKEMAWQSVIISNSEDVAVWKFKDLPKLAAGAKKYDVTTFEILGWDVGGIDRGYPQYRPEPRLGTPQEFRQALAGVKKLGVHPLIFSNIQVADTATQLYKEKLHRYVRMGKWAPDLVIFGWGEGTISARMGLAKSYMTAISPAHPEFRKLLVEQFIELVKDGADGFQLDKTVLQSLLDFNPDLPVPPDRAFTQELLSTFDEVVRRCREVNPEFALASEIFWDRSFPWVDVSYIRMGEVEMPSTALRYTFPEWTSTICAESPGDFNVMNNGMRYGLVWAMQPRHYNDSMDEPLTRPLSKYVQELIRIRRKHKDLLFHGRFMDNLGAEVKGGGEHVAYSVFEGMDGRGKACVVVNYGSEAATPEATWLGGEGRVVEILAPFQPDTTGKLPLKLRLAPQNCAVVVEV